MITIIESFISGWLKDILIVFIAISFLEIILPKGKMKKFVNFIIGLLLIYVIISPFIDLRSEEFNMVLQTNEHIGGIDSQNILEEQEDKIAEVFMNSIKSEIENLIESNTNFEVVNVEVNIKEEEESIVIEDLSLTIRKKEEKIRTIDIEQIRITESVENKENEHANMVNLISDYLGVDRNIVYISEIN